MTETIRLDIHDHSNSGFVEGYVLLYVIARCCAFYFDNSKSRLISRQFFFILIYVLLPTCISGFSVILGILKSAHKLISLNNIVQDNSNVTSTFKFGSKISSINMFGSNNESVTLKNEARLNVTLELLPKVS